MDEPTDDCCVFKVVTWNVDIETRAQHPHHVDKRYDHDHLFFYLKVFFASELLCLRTTMIVANFERRQRCLLHIAVAVQPWL